MPDKIKPSEEVFLRADAVVIWSPVMSRKTPVTAEPANVDGAILRLAEAELARQLARPLEAGLHLVATPLGNLGDMTLRAIAVLARADAIYCEDTRVSRTLLAHFGMTAQPARYHEHNAAAERPRILALLEAGKRVALICDAGTPLVSDPGYKLVRAAIEAGHRVTSVPGPSATLAALTASGLPSDTFLFAGFLPQKSGPRFARIRELRALPATLIVFEAPSRVSGALADMAEVMGATRPAAVARELTKLHEEVRRGTLGALAAETARQELRGELVILVGPAEAEEAGDDAIEARLREALTTMSLRDAAEAVARALGVPRSRAYDIGLRIKRS